MDCALDGCVRPAKKGQLCAAHSKRKWRDGEAYDRSPIARPQRGEALRWLQDVAQYDGDECRVWPFGRINSGYGSLIVDGHRTTTNRHVCRLVHGEPDAPDLEAAHSCGNRPCCTPRHLRWATRVENAADRLIDGTDARGEKNVKATITQKQVLKILNMLKADSATVVARKLGLTKAVVSGIAYGCSWSWLTGIRRSDTVAPERVKVTVRAA